MKPTKNRFFCLDCNRSKMLFETQKKAMTFMRFNGDEILEETGYKPERAYYCSLCMGWHLTSMAQPRLGQSVMEKMMTALRHKKPPKRVVHTKRTLELKAAVNIMPPLPPMPASIGQPQARPKKRRKPKKTATAEPTVVPMVARDVPRAPAPKDRQKTLLKETKPIRTLCKKILCDAKKSFELAEWNKSVGSTEASNRFLNTAESGIVEAENKIKELWATYEGVLPVSDINGTLGELKKRVKILLSKLRFLKGDWGELRSEN